MNHIALVRVSQDFPDYIIMPKTPRTSQANIRSITCPLHLTRISIKLTAVFSAVLFVAAAAAAAAAARQPTARTMTRPATRRMPQKSVKKKR